MAEQSSIEDVETTKSDLILMALVFVGLPVYFLIFPEQTPDMLLRAWDSGIIPGVLGFFTLLSISLYLFCTTPGSSILLFAWRAFVVALFVAFVIQLVELFTA